MFNIEGEKARHYLNFKNSEIKLTKLAPNYANPNNYDYSTLFVEKFNPNITLTTFFKTDEPIRLRYEIKRGSQIVFSNYIYYENQAVDEISNNRIKLIKSPMSKRYEPYKNLFITKNLSRVLKMIRGLLITILRIYIN